MRYVQEGGGNNFEQNPEGGTTSVTCEVNPTKSGYLTFDPDGLYIINWRPTEGQLLETSRPQRRDPSPDTDQNPTGSSTIPILEES